MPKNISLVVLDQDLEVKDADDEHVDIVHAGAPAHPPTGSPRRKPPDDGKDPWGHVTCLIAPGHDERRKLMAARRYDTFADMARDADLFRGARAGDSLYVRVAERGRVPKAHLWRSSARLPDGAELVIGLGGDHGV